MTHDSLARCPWCGTDPLYVAYHDLEWGVPVHDETRLCEFLILEGAQAGLSWLTILRKREHYRQAFAGFAAEKIARFGATDVNRLLTDAGIVRNRLKIEAAIRNARAIQVIRDQYGSLDCFLWQFVDGHPVQNCWRTAGEIPTSTPQSAWMSNELRRLGCNFVGPTICYALMQATGMVNDHLVDCYRHAQVTRSNDPP